MESNQQNRNNGAGLWALLAMAVLPVLCCGLPLLIGALGLTAGGVFLTVSRYWILGGLVFLVGIVMFTMSRRGRKPGLDSCCVIPQAKNSSKEKNQ